MAVRQDFPRDSFAAPIFSLHIPSAAGLSISPSLRSIQPLRGPGFCPQIAAYRTLQLFKPGKANNSHRLQYTDTSSRKLPEKSKQPFSVVADFAVCLLDDESQSYIYV